MSRASFLVFGAGAWGTALSIQLNKSGNEVFLSSFDQANLSNTHNKIGENSYDVSLTIKAEASYGEKTMFIAEVEQSGVFVMNGYDDQEVKDLIAVYCPSTLFPYAREMLSSMVAKGGFPALNLQPISFEALYAQAKEEQEQQTKN